MPTKPMTPLVMNLLLTTILALCGWGVHTTHQNSIALADLKRIVMDGKEARLEFTKETKDLFRQIGDSIANLDVRVTKLEGVSHKP